MKINLVVVLFVLGSFATGCAGILLPGHHAYGPFVAHTSAAPDEVFFAAQRVLGDIPGGHVRVSADGLTVTAWTVPQGGVRDRVAVHTRPDGTIAVTVESQLRATDGSWQRAGMSCNEYGYARERALAAEVLSRVGRPDDAPRLVARCDACVRVW